MKYVFFGSPRFARIVLEELIRSGEVPLALVCNPDRPSGRKKIITPPETKDFLEKAGFSDRVKVFQPEKLTDIKDNLEALKAEVFIVAAYAKIIPEAVLNVPSYGTWGVHPSLLPFHRGPTPLQTALLQGDEETGVSIYKMDREVDHGPVLGFSKISLSDSRLFYEELEEKLARLGAEKILNLIPQYQKGSISTEEQDHVKATFTHKFSSDDGFVEYGDYVNAQEGRDYDKALVIERMIRALTPEPGVWTRVFQKDGKEKRLKLLRAEIKDGRLVIRRGQWEGGLPMDF